MKKFRNAMGMEGRRRRRRRIRRKMMNLGRNRENQEYRGQNSNLGWGLCGNSGIIEEYMTLGEDKKKNGVI